MEIFGSSVDLTRLVFLLGAVLALIYKKKLGVTPGGIIVPGTLAGVLFSSFTAFVIMLVSSLLCMALYKIFFSSYALSGRWSSLAHISISIFIGLIIMAVNDGTSFFNQELALLSLVAPGLISISAQKYTLPKVMSGTLIVTALACLGGWLFAQIIPIESLTYLSVHLASFQPLTLPNPYIALPISLIVSILIYWNFGIRGGGYLIAPFLAAVAFSSPIQALLIFLAVGASYAIVTTVQRYSLLIGLERFVLSLFCGYIFVTIIDLLAISFNIAGYRPSPIVLIIAIAVLTNDLCLQRFSTSVSRGFTPSLVIAYLTRLAV